MSPDERREVLEQLLERVRRNAAARPLSAPPPPPVEAPISDPPTAVLAFDEPEIVPAAPVAAPPLVRFDFEEEQTSTGDAEQIEALVLAEVAAAEAAARGDEEPLSGPSTIPPAGLGDAGAPLELEDLDSLGAPAQSPSQAPRPITLPPLAPPPNVEHAHGAPVTPEEPPYVATPAVYEPPPAYEPPPPAFASSTHAEATSFEAEPPALVTAPPRYLTEPPPPPAVAPDDVEVDDEAVIELDEADLTSVPPEPMQAAFDAAVGAADDADPSSQPDHAGFVDRSSLAEIEERASVAPPSSVEPEAAPAPTAEMPAPAEPGAASAEPSRPAPPAPAPAELVPESQRQKRELDRPIDDVLEGVDEPPPESGEIESQRYPASATPLVDEVSVERVAEPDIDEAPTPAPMSRGAPAELLTFGAPSVVERPPAPAVDVATFRGTVQREGTTFGELLDRALSLGE